MGKNFHNRKPYNKLNIHFLFLPEIKSEFYNLLKIWGTEVCHLLEMIHWTVYYSLNYISSYALNFNTIIYKIIICGYINYFKLVLHRDCLDLWIYQLFQTGICLLGSSSSYTLDVVDQSWENKDYGYNCLSWNKALTET